MLIKLKLKIIWPNKSILKEVIKIGIPTALERLLSRICILLYGLIASKLGTEKYSIHSICYSTILKLEVIAAAFQAVMMIQLPKYKTVDERFEASKKMKKDYFLLIILLDYVFGTIILIISHGSLPLYKCFPYILFYSIQVFGLYYYAVYQTLLIVQGKPKIMLIGSFVGSLARLVLSYVFLNTDISLFIFGISNFIDFYIRDIIYKIGLSKIYKTSFNKEITEKGS